MYKSHKYHRSDKKKHYLFCISYLFILLLISFCFGVQLFFWIWFDENVFSVLTNTLIAFILQVCVQEQWGSVWESAATDWHQVRISSESGWVVFTKESEWAWSDRFLLACAYFVDKWVSSGWCHPQMGMTLALVDTKWALSCGFIDMWVWFGIFIVVGIYCLVSICIWMFGLFPDQVVPPSSQHYLQQHGPGLFLLTCGCSSVGAIQNLTGTVPGGCGFHLI